MGRVAAGEPPQSVLTQALDGDRLFVIHEASTAWSAAARAGMARVFAHQQLHEGAPVLSGRKYVLRTT
jgi:hypothetical protein